MSQQSISFQTKSFWCMFHCKINISFTHGHTVVRIVIEKSRYTANENWLNIVFIYIRIGYNWEIFDNVLYGWIHVHNILSLTNNRLLAGDFFSVVFLLINSNLKRLHATIRLFNVVSRYVGWMTKITNSNITKMIEKKTVAGRHILLIAFRNFINRKFQMVIDII